MSQSSEVLTLDDSPVIIGATGMDSVRQCLRTILRTLTYSVPLDRGFANDGNMIDSPAPGKTAHLAASLIDAIEKYEPRVSVASVTFEPLTEEQHMQGIVRPVVRFSLREGVEL